MGFGSMLVTFFCILTHTTGKINAQNFKGTAAATCQALVVTCPQTQPPIPPSSPSSTSNTFTQSWQQRISPHGTIKCGNNRVCPIVQRVQSQWWQWKGR
ncbi:hypothetical protein HS088_TW15G00861 [Tripterygium wilfordii]|uniref:Secreted protein n=1 Tax=Tripterygium wilfordii TaxID=458696 RepID=A0A7J7CMV0_TRIWF|nr:hypothetical protein HS088_TW15G00861 [Tripterygium wilfordii]